MAETIKIGGELESTATGNVVAAASAIKDKTRNKYQSEINDDVARHETEIHGTGGIDSRVTDLETMEQIVIAGGEAQIAQGSDFTNPDATKRAKIPTVGAIVDGLNDGIYDVSKRNPTGGPNSDGKFTLEYILSNVNTLIPASWRKGGMSIRFVSSSDNKYIQYRLMADEFTTDITQWAIANEGVYVENPEFVYVKVDAENKILWAIRTDGTIFYGAGVPPQVVNYINEKIAELSLDEYEDIVAFLNGLEEGDKTLQTLLNEKVDKEEGKSLIDEEYAEGVHYIENPEFAYVKTDAEGKILWAIKTDGTIYYGAGVPPQIANYLQNYLQQKVDKEVGKGLIDKDFADNMINVENPEYMYVVVDAEKKILGGRKKEGLLEEKIGIEIDKNKQYSTDDIEERLSMIVDRNKRVISFRDKKGYLHELAGIISQYLKINSIELTANALEELKTALKDGGFRQDTNWSNKTIWWCGTSIPAAGYWNVNNTFAYPYMVGVKLGAKKVYNEAVGSSCARRLTYTNSTYEVISRQMGNTISDALAICADIWTIDDANQTFTNGPRTLGITAIPNVNTYGDVCWQRMLLLSNCYEIKLVSKYLISNPEENENYLREKFGNLYETLVSLHPTAYIYQADIDLFVIDHGHNDVPSPVSTENINSTDITTFNGAINTYIRLIMQYKPHARIIFISDYDNSTVNSQTIEAQKQIATNWHIPFIDLREYLPFNINTKAKIRGYWSTDGYWQEDGFVYDPNAADVAHAFSVNGDAYFPHYVGNTIQSIAEHINPQQDDDGNWWYEYEPRYIYIKDGLHPHTDKSGKCLRLYANVLASFINYLGNNIV